MNQTGVNIVLADDDDDDCLFFKDALGDIHFSGCLKTVSNGEDLMILLQQNSILPDVVFLDLNMPLKNGFECLAEIRNMKQFNDLKIIIFSTANDLETIQTLYERGANYFIQKPSSFSQLKNVLDQALDRLLETKVEIPVGQDDFVIRPVNGF